MRLRTEVFVSMGWALGEDVRAIEVWGSSWWGTAMGKVFEGMRMEKGRGKLVMELRGEVCGGDSKLLLLRDGGSLIIAFT